jgi:hypothetical protein
MTLIDAATMNALTALDVSAMNESWTITTVTRVDDGAGSYTETTSTATVLGYLWSATGDETGDDQIRARGQHRIALPKGTVVNATSRITQVATGKVFDVVYPFPVTAYSTSLIVGVRDH